MSMTENEQQEKNKMDEIYNSLKDLDVMELVSKKASVIKELEKNLKQVSAVDVSKGSERSKLMKNLDKQVEKVKESLLHISMVEKMMKEKDY